MSQKPPFTTIGDEPIEARIVAWVLGDASAFEAAELERLCDERPELLVFRRRMRALHGLLSEAETAEPDHSVKLSPQKRQALDEIFGAEELPNVMDHPSAARPRRRSWRQGLLAIAACLVLLAGLAALFPAGSISVLSAHKTAAGATAERQAASARESEVVLRELKKAIRNQEDVVEERKKVLANIARAKGIIYTGPDSYQRSADMDDDHGAKSAMDTSKQNEQRGEAVKRGLDAASVADAKSDLESDQALLQQMKLKLLDEEIAGKMPDDGKPQMLAFKGMEDTQSLARQAPAGNKAGNGSVVPLVTDLPPAMPEGTPGPPITVDLGDAGTRQEEAAGRMPAPRGPGILPGASDQTTQSTTSSGLPGPRIVLNHAAPPPASTPGETELARRRSEKSSGESTSLGIAPDLAENAKRPPATASPMEPASPGGVNEEIETSDVGGQLAAASGKPAPPASLAKMPRPSTALAATSPKRVAAEGARSTYKMPEPVDHFGEMSPLAALGGGGLAGRMGGAGASHGFGKGIGNGDGSNRRPDNEPSSAVLADASSDAASSAMPSGFTGYVGGQDAAERPASGPSDGLAPEPAAAGPAATRFLTKNVESAQKGLAGLSSDASKLAKDERGGLTSDGTETNGLWFDAEPPKATPPVSQPPVLPTLEFDGFMNYGAPIHARQDKNGLAVTEGTRSGGGQVDQGSIDALLDGPSRVESGNPQALPSAALPTLESLPATGKLFAAKDADRYLVEARDAYAKNNYQLAYDTYAKGLALLPDAPAAKDRREFLRQSLGDVAVALANDAIKDGNNDEAKAWLGKAVEWNPNNETARQKVVADVASEATAAEAPYSTFSLSISDASFKMAQAALARGERPEPSSIKVEQFYNAVDYGDPAPGPNEAVAGRVEQAAHPVIPGRNLVRVAVRTGAAGRSAAQALRLTLLVDQSGSMARDDRRAAMALALKQLAGLLTKNDLVTVIGFSRTPRLLADAITGDQAATLNAMVNQAASEGGTNLEEAMKLGEQLALRHLTAGAQNRIVLFTDGAANLGDADPSRLADKVSAMRQKGLAFDIAGIGTSNLNDQLLAELARHGNGRYCVVGAETDAGSSFARQLAGAFHPAAENVKVQVRFNPQRVGRYKLLGFEEHRLKTEDFRNDAVDAAELAAEEAGVALYQVEPLPEGSGELGEASLRFRDAASGQMVERTWTIPYEAAAPAFDRAVPSLQLAGLALLAAEKLRGGPLAEAIDFKQLAAARATVKQFYANSRRVAEMLEMVDKL